VRWLARLVFLIPVVGTLSLAGCASSAPQTLTEQDVLTQSDESPEHRRARIRTELASAYLQRGQATVALDEVKLALQASTTYAPAHQLKGLAYMALGRPELAQSSFDTALRLAPNDVDLLHNVAWLHCSGRDYTQAQEWFDRALEAGAGARSWLGKALCEQRSQGPRANHYFAQAYALAPRDPQVVVGWAELAWAQSDWARVHELLQPYNLTEGVTAQTLWLQTKALHQMGESVQAQRTGNRLRALFGDSAQAKSFERKLWNE
jgi:type IV pilus assembly protein PilF